MAKKPQPTNPDTIEASPVPKERVEYVILTPTGKIKVKKAKPQLSDLDDALEQAKDFSKKKLNGAKVRVLQKTTKQIDVEG